MIINENTIKNNDTGKIYKTSEACARLRISGSTFWKIVKSGRLKTIRITPGKLGRIGVLESDINDYIKSLSKL